MIPAWHTCILIPARNEEDLLPRCLASISEARANLPAGVTSDVVIVVDSSTDRTAAIAEHLVTEPGAIVVTDAGVVGTARQIAARTSLQRFSGPLSRCWLAHTDADCIVPEDWLVKQLFLAEDGIEAVAGIISVDTFSEHGPEVEERFHNSYPIDPHGAHSHVHGANLGIRADVYRRSGG